MNVARRPTGARAGHERVTEHRQKVARESLAAIVGRPIENLWI